MANVDYESILCVKPQVHVFRIPPRPSNRGYRASDWKLDQPDWTGRLRVVAKGTDLFIKLEDKTSGELFAKCPVETYPGIAVEAVTDSSRYFVLRIKDDGGKYVLKRTGQCKRTGGCYNELVVAVYSTGGGLKGRSAFIGIGFEDRGDSFDLNVALQDHFKHLRQEKEAEKSIKELEKGPKLDLGFKEGQTIRINISTKKNPEEEDTTPKKARPKPAGGMGFLPPPPGGVGAIKVPPPGGASASSLQSQQKISSSSPVQNNTNNADLLLDFGGTSENSSIGQTAATSSSQNNTQSQNVDLLGGFDSNFDPLRSEEQAPAQPVGGSDPWGEFTSASTGNSNTDWIAF